jgi:anti-sigma factor RsiW
MKQGWTIWGCVCRICRNHAAALGYRSGSAVAFPPLSALMDCRSFKKKHLAFLDDTLPGTETSAMKEHMHACSRCAEQDAAIRRSLLLVRNLPTIAISPDFSERLRRRVHVEAQAPHTQRLFHGPSVGTFFAIAGAVVAIGTISISLATIRGVPDAPPRLSAVVVAPATTPDKELDGDLVAPAFIASMSTGIPVWPALLLAEEGSVRFATAGLNTVSYQPTPQP